MPNKIEGDLSHASFINTNDDGDSYAGSRIGGFAKGIEDFSKAFSEFESHVLLTDNVSSDDVMNGVWKGSMITEKRGDLSIHFFPNNGLIQNRKEVNYTIQGIVASITFEGEARRYDIKETGSTAGVQMLDPDATVHLPNPGEARTYVFTGIEGEKVGLSVISGRNTCELGTFNIPHCPIS